MVKILTKYDSCLSVVFIKFPSHALAFALSSDVPGSRDAANLGAPAREEEQGRSCKLWEPVWHSAAAWGSSIAVPQPLATCGLCCSPRVLFGHSSHCYLQPTQQELGSLSLQ